MIARALARSGRRQSLAQARQAAEGKMVSLSQGATYYEQTGDTSAPTAVLIHGFSVPSYVWDPTYAGLGQAGLRVLRYDLYGRGLSDRPKVRYDRHLFVRQLEELLAALGVAEPVHLIGLSMGGSLAAGFAAAYPSMSSSLALLAPAGLMDELPTGTRLWRWLSVSDAIARHSWLNQRDALRPYDLADRDRRRDYLARYRQQMRWPGFTHAIFSTMRHGPLSGQQKIFAQVARQDTPTLVIWGEQDRTVPFQLLQPLRRLLPNAQCHTIPSAGHIAHFEQPETVNPLLIDHIYQHVPGGQP